MTKEDAEKLADSMIDGAPNDQHWVDNAKALITTMLMHNNKDKKQQSIDEAKPPFRERRVR